MIDVLLITCPKLALDHAPPMMCDQQRPKLLLRRAPSLKCRSLNNLHLHLSLGMPGFISPEFLVEDVSVYCTQPDMVCTQGRFILRLQPYHFSLAPGWRAYMLDELATDLPPLLICR